MRALWGLTDQASACPGERPDAFPGWEGQASSLPEQSVKRAERSGSRCPQEARAQRRRPPDEAEAPHGRPDGARVILPDGNGRQNPRQNCPFPKLRRKH